MLKTIAPIMRHNPLRRQTQLDGDNATREQRTLRRVSQRSEEGVLPLATGAPDASNESRDVLAFGARPNAARMMFHVKHRASMTLVAPIGAATAPVAIHAQDMSMRLWRIVIGAASGGRRRSSPTRLWLRETRHRATATRARLLIWLQR